MNRRAIRELQKRQNRDQAPSRAGVTLESPKADAAFLETQTAIDYGSLDHRANGAVTTVTDQVTCVLEGCVRLNRRGALIFLLCLIVASGPMRWLLESLYEEHSALMSV